MEVVIIKLTAAISIPGIKIKPAKVPSAKNTLADYANAGEMDLLVALKVR